MTSAAHDPVTGRTTIGFSGERLEPPSALKSRLPDPSREPWSTINCAEVAACSRQIDHLTDEQAQAAILDRLQVYTVRTRTGEFAAPCNNCSVWLPGG